MDEQLKNLVNNSIEAYFTWRNSNEWDEAYKWDVLPKLQQKLSQFSNANLENIDEIIKIYEDSNPKQGSFVHFNLFTDFKNGLINNKQAVVDVINHIWTNEYDLAQSRYITFSGYNETVRSLGTPGLGYIAAGRDPQNNPICRGEFIDGLSFELENPFPTQSTSEKYGLYKKYVNHIAEHMTPIINERGLDSIYSQFPAITGQDFLYFKYFGWEDKKILFYLKKFINQAKHNLQSSQNDSNLKKNDYKFLYKGLNVTASFGQGGLAKVPWLGFNFNNELGFSPTFLYYVEYDKLILAYDHLARETPKHNWTGIEDKKTINEYFTEQGIVVDKFESSKVFKVYDTSQPLPDTLVNDTLEIIDDFKSQIEQLTSSTNDIRHLVSDFVIYCDESGRERNKFKGEMYGLKYRSWFTAQSNEYLKTPWIAFGADNNERGSTWPDCRIVILYIIESDEIALIYKWRKNGIEIPNSSNDPFGKEFRTIPIWDDWRVRKIYSDAHNITNNFENDFKQLIEEYKKYEGEKTVDPPSINKTALNTILYGPPGTGKTYSAINVFAEKLLAGQAGQNRSEEEVLADRLKDLTWWQVTALALYHESNPIKVAALSNTQIIKAYSRYVKNRTTNVKPTLWATLQERSDYESSKTTYRVEGVEYFKKNDQSEWSLTDSGKSFVEEALTDIDLNAEAEIGTDWKKFYRTITFHQSYSYEEFVEGIRPVINPDEESGQIRYEVKEGIFKELCTIASLDPNNKYLLIIDEINRGNISKVFGELITLLEDDKRDSLYVRLPYSKPLFTIPKNLYVLGTMNTADRSIALLDIALRRRFNFIELMPDYDLVQKNIAGVELASLLKCINEKIEVMLDRDHQIGHSYFMKAENEQDLHNAWYNRILPLLSEYFYNDWERLSELVGIYKEDKQLGFVDNKSSKNIQKLFGKETEYSEAIVGNFHTYGVNELVLALKAIYEDEPQAD